MLNKLAYAAVAFGALVMASGAAMATQVPNGGQVIFGPTNPFVDTVAQTITFGFPIITSTGTGGFASVPNFSFGSSTGTISYSTTLNALTLESIPNLVSFSDGAGGTFSFNLSSVQTSGYTSSPSFTLSLYLLGTITDTGGFGYDPTAASFTLGITQTGASAYSASGTISVPPVAHDTDVPEPATIALLGAGLAGLGMLRRKKV